MKITAVVAVAWLAALSVTAGASMWSKTAEQEARMTAYACGPEGSADFCQSMKASKAKFDATFSAETERYVTVLMATCRYDVLGPCLEAINRLHAMDRRMFGDAKADERTQVRINGAATLRGLFVQQQQADSARNSERQTRALENIARCMSSASLGVPC